MSDTAYIYTEHRHVELLDTAGRTLRFSRTLVEKHDGTAHSS